MVKRALNGQKGFTLIELLAVMSILGILAAIVSGSVGGIGAQGQAARLVTDEGTLGTAADRFFTDAFPQTYPVVSPDSNGDGLLDTNDMPPLPAGDTGIRVLEFDARLPQEPTQIFVPDYLKGIPDSAALVSWRVNTRTGEVFFAEQGSALIPASAARLAVSAADRTVSAFSDHLLELTMKKNEAAIEVLTAQIPAGYLIGAQSLPAGKVVGTLEGTFAGDNPWDTGQIISFFGTLETTGTTNLWELKVDYAVDGNSNEFFVSKTNSSTSGSTTGFAGTQRPSRTHVVTVVEPASDAPGVITITMNRGTDSAHNQVTETWKLTILDNAQERATSGGLLLEAYVDISPAAFVIRNPSISTVARWLAEEHTTIDVPETFDSVMGNQAVIIQAPAASS